MQKTRLNSILERVSDSFEYIIFTSWKKTSAALLALLLGFYLGSSLASILLIYLKEDRSLTALLLVAIVELTVRIRHRLNQDKLPISIIVIDNLRLGSVYALVSEAFKLGS